MSRVYCNFMFNESLRMHFVLLALVRHYCFAGFLSASFNANIPLRLKIPTYKELTVDLCIPVPQDTYVVWKSKAYFRSPNLLEADP